MTSTPAAFRILFDPTSGGAKTATVTVTTNDVFEYDYTFAVRGNGVYGG